MGKNGILYIAWVLAAGLGWSASAAQKARSAVVPYSVYEKWTEANKKKYVSELRTAWFELERDTRGELGFAFHREENLFWDRFLPRAFADSPGFCLIGGVKRPTAMSGDRVTCPTFGRPCGEFGENGYKCGAVFNEACIARDPKNTISLRCREAAGDQLPPRELYEAKRSQIESVAADCRDQKIDSRYQLQCNRFLERVDKAQKVYGGSAPAPSPAAVEPVRPADPVDEAVRQYNEPREDQPRAPVTRDVPPPARVEAQVSGDCMNRYQAKLGSLACVACGMESVAEAEIKNNGGGVSKWVSLVGIMAQTYYGPYNTADSHSRQSFQMRVAEMISSYGYCTDREYPAAPSAYSRDWIDGRASLRGGQAQMEFATSYGLMSNKRTLFSSRPENSNDPMRYAKELFDHTRSGGFDQGSVQTRQWRFRSKLKAHRTSYEGTPFSQCGNAIESRLRNSKFFRMCPVRERLNEYRHLKIDRPAKMTATEIANNANFYSAIARSCGFPSQRRRTHDRCDHECWGSRVYIHTSPYIYNCDYEPPRETGGGGDRDNPGKGGEPSHDRDNPGKGGEGGDHDRGGGHDGGGGGPGGGGPGGGGKGGEGGGTAR